MSKVIGILAIVLIGIYWAHTQKLKSRALTAARKRCDVAGVQLLDHSVVFHRFALARDSNNRLRLQREYLFEFTSTGEARYQGKVTLLGQQVGDTELQAYSIN